MSPIDHDPVAYYQKRLLVLRTTLTAMSWHKSLRCLEFALRYHVNFRKDGKTPEFLHQVEQALFALTLRKNLRHPEETICAILLHDTLEDYYKQGVRIEMIQSISCDMVARSVEFLTNHTDDVEKPKKIYYNQMANDVIASIVKACDRMNNQSTMAGVFTAERMRFKIDETLEYVLPMLKVAKRTFTDQNDAYENLKTVLEQQVRLLEQVLMAKTR